MSREWYVAKIEIDYVNTIDLFIGESAKIVWKKAYGKVRRFKRRLPNSCFCIFVKKEDGIVPAQDSCRADIFSCFV